MRTKTVGILGLLLFLTGWQALAAIDVYQFANESDRVRFQQLTQELRCPKCQNQNIADSNAPIAQDLRAKIQIMLGEKKSDQEIVDYMIERYGDFVLYQPRLDTKTYLLWFGPVIFLILGFIVVIVISRKKAKAHAANVLNEQQKKQLKDLLNDTGNHSS